MAQAVQSAEGFHLMGSHRWLIAGRVRSLTVLAGTSTQLPDRADQSRRGSIAHSRHARFLLMTFLVLLATMSSSLAFAGEAEQDLSTDPLESLTGAISPNSQSFELGLTDSEAAGLLPHRNLDREQALELLKSVFSIQLEAPAGPFDELHVKKFLADDVAVIGNGQQLEQTGIAVGDDPSKGEYKGPTLIDSTIPLRTEDSSGRLAVIDLGLERREGELQPSNPLVEVVIPELLGDGIELPSAGVTIELDEGPALRGASIVNQSVAFYPNIARDSDLIISPTPTGFETLTQLRSSDAPTKQTFRLNLPEGAALEATTLGGAQVVQGERILLTVLPPTALDAKGQGVPVSLRVSDNSLSLEVVPDDSTAYPVLVDPTYEGYNWINGSTVGLSDWSPTTTTSAFAPANQIVCPLMPPTCAMGLPKGLPGLYLHTVAGKTMLNNDKAQWSYYVPRWASDQAAYGVRPTSFIASMHLQNLYFHPNAFPEFPTGANLSLVAGIWDSTGSKWTAGPFVRKSSEGGLFSGGTSYYFPGNNNQNAKQAVGLSFASAEARALTGRQEAYLGTASMVIGDTTAPGFGSISSPTKWMHDQPAAINFTISDSGLGVHSVTITDTALPEPASNWSWTTSRGCYGNASNPCPRIWKSTDAGAPPLQYLPLLLTQGIHTLKVTASDPLGIPGVSGNVSTPANIEVKIDHTAPNLALSGSMTNQINLGPYRPRYVLKLSASDGTSASPQSGVASTKVTVDGQTVDPFSGGCTTQNCTADREWVLNSSAFSPGAHFVNVTATDAVGLTTTKMLLIGIQRDTTGPAISVSGPLFNGPRGWIEQKVHGASITASDSMGHGVTSLLFKIDGKQINSWSQSCPDGACSTEMSSSVNVANYSGGAHIAEIVATDGAGNVSTKNMVFNVNPSGQVSTQEAVATFEAMDETNETGTVAPTSELLELEQIEHGDNPGLVQNGDAIESTGVPNTTVMTTDPAEGVVVEGPDGATAITPDVDGSANSIKIVENVAAVAANTADEVDSVVRPRFNGLTTFEAIRDPDGAQSYSWDIELSSGQTLAIVDSEAQSAEVKYANGVRAFLISNEGARDAAGDAVSSHFTVNGNTLTLHVAHTSGSYVYPVVSGQAFETSYESILIVEPPPPPPPEESPPPPPPGGTVPAEIAWSLIAPGDKGKSYVPAPGYDPDGGGASASSVYRYFALDLSACGWLGCGTWVIRMNKGGFYRGPFDASTGSPAGCEIEIKSPWGLALNAGFEGSGWTGHQFVQKGGGKHLTAYCRYWIQVLAPEGPFERYWTFFGWVWPNGYQERIIKERDPSIVEG